MNAITLKRLQDLRNAMESDPRVKRLEEAEAVLKADPSLSLLLEKKNEALGRYLTIRLECGEDSEEAKEALKTLHQAKLALDEQPSAREYSLRFSELNLLYLQIDDILFGPYREKARCGVKHD